ncbi:hypothetical protein A1OE_1075 [Candidatus Endolissoclinum faulkneri L2]|uniref:Uncharacterized protein n=1 Tax=Candidatus Endolissoclinum faulkneri L2 TaxID=1193729 RepID=K7Z5C8_9PROT|nr:hypothetical protein A1OE_1075 [Candidatus Endolissoclinum faulkneri L2]
MRAAAINKITLIMIFFIVLMINIKLIMHCKTISLQMNRVQLF